MENNSFFDYEHWNNQAERLRPEFRSIEPFPHIVLENFINPEYGAKIISEFPSPTSPKWRRYKHFNENKQAQTKRELIPPLSGRLIDEFNSPAFLQFLSNLTGIKNLLPDPALEGGGLHQVLPKGFLNIHADFTSHPHKKNWLRRINLLLYFNKDWQDAYGGHLEFWDKQCKGCVKKILPVFNRAVFFETNPDSYHGHPDPLHCPPDQTRKAIALYYFTEEKSVLNRSTEYKARPGDSFFKKRLLMADKWALRGYDFLKRRFGLSDDTAEKILKIFFK